MSSKVFFYSVLSQYFDRQVDERRAGPNTVFGYRDTFSLLVRHAQANLRKNPSELLLSDISPEFVGTFLQYLTRVRGNKERTRNTRLAAIKSLFQFVSIRYPDYSRQCAAILDIRRSNYDKRSVDFLTLEELNALLAQPDRRSRTGGRDYLLMLMCFQAGLRVSELTGLRCGDVVLGPHPYLTCMGKGRKRREIPLHHDTVPLLKAWLTRCGGRDEDPLFPTRHGKMSRDNVERLVRQYALGAVDSCPSLAKKRVTPHVLRHSTAMGLIVSGVDRVTTSVFLGHASVKSTDHYVHADLRLKRRALERMTSPSIKPNDRFEPDDALIIFLKNLDSRLNKES